MDKDIRAQRTEELITELYGEGNPVSEEEVAGLVRGLQNERHYYAMVLAEAIALTGMSVEELTKKLSKDYDDGPLVNLINPNSPLLGAHYLAQLNHACEQLRDKGYVGEQLIKMLNTPFLQDDFSTSKITVFEAVQSGMRGLLFFELPNADQS